MRWESDSQGGMQESQDRWEMLWCAIQGLPRVEGLSDSKLQQHVRPICNGQEAQVAGNWHLGIDG